MSGVFDDDFRLSDSESSEEEGDDVYTYSEKHNIACGEVVALRIAISCEPTEDHNEAFGKGSGCARLAEW